MYLVFAAPTPLRDELLGWGTLASGTVASVAMATYLLLAHPRLRSEMREFSAQDPDLADLPVASPEGKPETTSRSG
jgi:hypothetical protein